MKEMVPCLVRILKHGSGMARLGFECVAVQLHSKGSHGQGWKEINESGDELSLLTFHSDYIT
jgi:hypothetical protein